MLNERAGVGLMLRELESALPADGEWEVVVVDDGSTDGTADEARKELEGRGFGWRIVRLSRNFGHQAAYMAGLHHARGEAVVMLDADLQDPPGVIPALVTEWKKGAKLVVGVRLSRAERGWRRWCFDGFHTVFHRLTGGVMPKNSGNFGLVDRVIVERLKEMRERNLFLPALRAWVGYPMAEVKYHRNNRADGDAKMNWRRLTNLAWDGISSFSSVPLKMIGWLGMAVAVPSLLWGGWLILQRVLQAFGLFKGLEVLGFTTVAVAILFLGGVQLVCLGVLGEYLGRIYKEVKGRPQFLVMEVLEGEAVR